MWDARERVEPKSRITLVPFAGINLIRFRGSRINGLSRCLRTRHSDKKKPVLLRVGM